MNEITYKEKLSELNYRYKIKNPKIAKKRKAGQFIILRCAEGGERIPLTIVSSNETEGTFDIIFQVVGKTTKDLSLLNVGDKLLDVAGPLGNPTHIENFGTCVMIGGGVGIAPLYPITKALKEAGNEIISILGARSKNLLLLVDEFKELSDELHIATDDGSEGIKGFVSNVLQDIIDSGKTVNFVIAIGPVIMMKVIADLTRKYNITTMASLNPIMLDGTGMCGGCRVMIDGESKFACVHGPEFDAHKVDFDGLIRRLGMFKEQEQHICKIGLRESSM